MEREQILYTITAARDSVWVIEDSIEKLANGATPSEELQKAIERNVGHLKIVTSNQDIVDSGEDISDLEGAISTGEAKLEEDIWNFN